MEEVKEQIDQESICPICTRSEEPFIDPRVLCDFCRAESHLRQNVLRKAIRNRIRRSKRFRHI